MKVEIREIQQQAANDSSTQNRTTFAKASSGTSSTSRSPFAVYVDGAYHCAADSREHAMSLIAERFPKAELVGA